MKKAYFLVLLAFFYLTSERCFSQFNLNLSKSRKIKFKLINNLIIIPVELNGGTLSFVLDSGVTKPILFNLTEIDSTALKTLETRYIKGLGGGSSVKALISKGNLLKVGDAIRINTDVYTIYNSSFNLTPKLGLPVHGIIGYDLFKDFIIEINYSSKYIRLHNHNDFNFTKLKNWVELPLIIVNKKSYLDAEIKVGSKLDSVRLLIDTGASDALWLFDWENHARDPHINRYFEDFLGHGLSGSVYGKRSQLQTFKIGKYVQNEVNVAFPDSLSLNSSKMYNRRNGSLSGGLLKRFNIYFNYRDAKIYLKKNTYFKTPYHYNGSGIEIEQTGVRIVKETRNLINTSAFDRLYKDQSSTPLSTNSTKRTSFSYVLKPSFQVVQIRPNSNADKVGMKVGDFLISINDTPTHTLSLQDINEFFYDEPGKLINIVAERKGQTIEFSFVLEDMLQKKDLQNNEGL